jgi:hypothetical protein
VWWGKLTSSLEAETGQSESKASLGYIVTPQLKKLKEKKISF